jgi:hypothetical protein
MKKKAVVLLGIGMAMMLSIGSAPVCRADETGLFTSIAPDAMIVLDLSGSMKWNPPGDHDASNQPINIYSDPTCAGPFYDNNNVPGYDTYCARYAIARRTIFNILDDNHSGIVGSQDETSLNIRIGLGKFQGSSYDKLRDIGAKYSLIYCGNNSSCTVDQSSGDASNIRYWMSYSNVVGATPLVSGLTGVKAYLDVHKAADSYQNCRQKFVILVTDGADTMSCSGAGYDTQADQYKRRRDSVVAAKALADAGYKVFVIGMGSNMPDYLKNTLNWMAYYGSSDNPLVENGGDETAFDPAAVSSCGSSSTTGTCDGSSTNCFATSNDPGTLNLSGYAFLANNATELEAAFRQAISVIREATYSFTQASVASSRLIDENFIYEAAFQPINGDPFWLGHLTKYQINNDGTIGAALWDAGQRLQGTIAADRNIKTYKTGSAMLIPFTAANITAADLGVATETRKNEVVGYIRGENASPTYYNKDNWKLGDTFRSNPITVGTPSLYYRDFRDGTNAFSAYRTMHARTSANGKRIVVAGANDGQLHACRTDTGAEAWSFIPPNVLNKLKDIAHKSHPTGLTHQYYVDGPISVADVWLGTGDGTTKSPGDWHTLLIFAEGRGASANLWSSSSSCDANFRNIYMSGFGNYCGYYSLDITDTASPIYKWRVMPISGQEPYLGDPWSKMMVHRVRIGGQERWVGFIGGGHNLSSCSGPSCDTRGKGFFVVDLKTGEVLWGFTRAEDVRMDYAIPGTAAIVDSDNDGFTDLAYIGDMGGNVWRLRFCTQADPSSCGTGSWTGSLLYRRDGGSGQIYDQPSVTKDTNGNVWVYWATGNKAEPIAMGGGTDQFYAVKDMGLSGTVELSNLENITSSNSYADDPSKRGWYIQFTGMGERCISEPAVFAGIVYFTTYTPAAAVGGDMCNNAGTAKLYAISYLSGAGSLTGGARSMTLGVGVPTAPVLSINPLSNIPDLYVTLSGGAGTGATTMRANVNPPSIANRTNLIHWRDRRF